jgi:hypothetical protein
MKILEKLKELAIYYELTRQSGHTSAMLNGAKNSPTCLVLTHSHRMGKELEIMANKKLNTICLNNNYTLRGYYKPLLIDNAELYLIFSKAAIEIERLTDENKKLKNKI